MCSKGIETALPRRLSSTLSRGLQNQILRLN